MGKVIIVSTKADKESLVNHDVAGGAGCKNKREGYVIPPPLMSLYIASELKKKYMVVFYDCNTSPEKEPELLEEKDVDAYVLCGSLTTIKSDEALIKDIKSRDEAYIVYVNAAYYALGKKKEIGADATISGDAELCILDLIEKKEKKNTWIRMDQKDAQTWPFPDWSLLDIKKYTSYTIESSRGCAMKCPHCPYYLYQNSRIVYRDISDVLREIKRIIDLKADYFLFRDPCFTYDMERTANLMQELVKEKLRINWGCETRVEFLTEELIKQMKVAGCVCIRMGVEAANERILRRAGRLNILKSKDEYLNQVRRATEWCGKYQIKTVHFYMVGFPEETVESIEEIKRFVKTSNPDVAIANYIVPYPGTVYHEELQKSGLIEDDNLSNYGSKNSPVSKVFSLRDDELRKEKEKLDAFLNSRNRQFYPIR